MYVGGTWLFLNNSTPEFGTLIKHNNDIWAGVWPGVVKVNLLTVGIQKNNAEKIDVKVYPVPSSEVIHIESAGTNYLQSIKISNVLGQSLYHKTFTGLKMSESIYINSFTKGVYFLHVNTSDGNSLHKIIID